MWTLIKNNPWKTFFIALAVIYGIIALVKGEANPMNWFSSTPSTERKVFRNCINGQWYVSACPTCPSAATGEPCTNA